MDIYIYMYIYTSVKLSGIYKYIYFQHINLEKHIVYILSTGGDTKVMTPG